MGKKGKVVTYTLKKERHYDEEPIPKRTRQIRAQMEQAELNNDPIKFVNLALELVEMFDEVCDYGLVIQYAEEALRKIKHIKSLSRICSAFRNLEGYDKALQVCQRYLKRAREANLQEEVLQAKFEYGLAYLSRGEHFDDKEDYQNALKFFKMAFSDVTQIHGLDKISEINIKFDLTSNIGITHMHLKEFVKAKEFFERSLKIAIEQRDQDNMRKTYTNLALLYEHMGEPAKCIEYSKKELAQWDIKSHDPQILIALNEFATRYQKFGMLRDALAVFKELENKSILMGNDDDMIVHAKDSIRELEELMEKARQIPKYEPKIIQARQIKNYRVEYKLYGERAEIYKQLSKCKEAIHDYLAQLNILTKTTERFGEIYLVYEGLAVCYFQLNEFADSANNFRQMFQYAQFDLDVKGYYLFQYAKALSLSEQHHDLVMKVYNEINDISSKLSDLEMEKESLLQQELLHRKFQYPDRAKACRMRIREIEHILKEREAMREQQDELGSVSSSDIEEIVDCIPDSLGQETSEDRETENQKNLMAMNDKSSIVSDSHIWQISDIQEEDLLPKLNNINEVLKKKRKYQVQSLDEAEDDPIVSTGKSLLDCDRLSECDFDSVTLDTISKKADLEIQQSVTKKAFVIDDEEDDEISSPLKPPKSNPTISIPKVQPMRSSIEGDIILSRNKVNERSDKKAGLTANIATSFSHASPPLGNDDSQSTRKSISSSTQPTLVVTPKQNSRIVRQARRIWSSSTNNSSELGLSSNIAEKENIMHSRRKSSSPTNTSSLTPVNHKNVFNTQQSQSRKPLKIRLSIGVKGKETETLAIPCPNGPRGTPKTVKWLIEEAQRRYSDIHKVTPIIQKLVTEDADTNDLETLCKDDPISDVLVHNQKVFAVLTDMT